MKNKLFSLIFAILLCSYNSIESIATDYSYNSSNSNYNLLYDEPGNIALAKFLTIFTSNIKDLCLMEEPIEINFFDHGLIFSPNEREFYGFQILIPEMKHDVGIGVYWILTEKNRFYFLCADFMELQMRSTYNTHISSTETDKAKQSQDLLNNTNWRYKSTLFQAIELENAPNTFLDLHIIHNRQTQEIIILCEKKSSYNQY